MQKINSVKDELILASKDLDLSFEPQDWGIINSDPKRTFEFIDYLENNKHSNQLKYWLTELILASINDGFIENYFSKKKNYKLKEYLQNSKNIDKTVLKYWNSLQEVPNKNEFPIADWLEHSVFTGL